MTHPMQAAVVALALLAALAVPAAQADEGAWDRIKGFAHAQKSDAVAEGKRLLAETDRKIAELKKDMKHSTAEARKAHEANMKELAAKKKAAQAELAKMQKAASGAWDATKEGAVNAYRDLQQAYEKAARSAKS